MSKFDLERFRRGNKREPVIPSLMTAAVIIVVVAAIVAIVSVFGN
jgi:hypothetical protein